MAPVSRMSSWLEYPLRSTTMNVTLLMTDAVRRQEQRVSGIESVMLRRTPLLTDRGLEEAFHAAAAASYWLAISGLHGVET